MWNQIDLQEERERELKLAVGCSSLLSQGSMSPTTFFCHSPPHDRTRPGQPTLEPFWKMLAAAALAPEKVSIALATEITQVQGTEQVVTWSLLE